jgi:hypothetical protein
VIQTWLSAQAGEQMRTDDNVKDSHGTMAASKAAGNMYGVAKEVRYACLQYKYQHLQDAAANLHCRQCRLVLKHRTRNY